MEHDLPGNIPDAIKLRTPLIQKEWLPMLHRLGEHPHAPHWNAQCGDRLTAEDLVFIKQAEEALVHMRMQRKNEPDEKLVTWIDRMKSRSLWFAEKVKADFFSIPFMTRYDMQARLERLIPADEDLKRLIVNPTSGTTGHPIYAPNHPRAIGCYDPFIQFALNRHQVNAHYDHRCVAALQLCAQEKTITYHTVHAYLQGAGFAKLNLNRKEWLQKESPAIYLGDMQPVFLSGDPFSFSQAMALGLNYKPRALLSCALALNSRLREKLANFFSAPIIDFYSLNETGPLGYSCPLEPAYFHQLPTDIFLETVDEQGNPCREGQVGELVVTGGRNPYLPLLRYKTGDKGALFFAPCPCGDPMPRVKLSDTRELVLFYTQDGVCINPVDISRIIRRQPVSLFQVHQAVDYSLQIRILAEFDFEDYHADLIIRDVKELFNNSVPVTLIRDAVRDGEPVKTVNNKLRPFSSDLTVDIF